MKAYLGQPDARRGSHLLAPAQMSQTPPPPRSAESLTPSQAPTGGCRRAGSPRAGPSTEGPPPPEGCRRAGCAGHGGCSRQAGWTDRPTKPGCQQGRLLLPLLLFSGTVLTSHPARMGGSSPQRGVAPPPSPLSQSPQTCAGSRAALGLGRLPAGVLLGGCQAMAKANTASAGSSGPEC